MMKRYLLFLFFCGAFLACKKTGVKEGSAPVNPPVTAVVDTSRTSWWEKARFGMMIHWGVYSVPAGIYNGDDISQPSSPHYGSAEWLMHNCKIPVAVYRDYAKQFNPDSYNPEQWVLMAKAAGMKYIVITTKHHEGFAMFDTQFSDWSIMKASPYGKDLIRPLVDACRKYGMKIGFYYSQADDWVNKGGSTYDATGWDPAQAGSMDDYIDKVAVPQLRELLTKYGDVAELWWDNQGVGMTAERAAKFLPLLSLQPKMISNNRLFDPKGGDFDTPEQHIAASDNGRLWESCMTMNDTWGFSKNDKNWKSSQTLIRNLIETASLGGNFLLNVGPEASGKFPQPIIDRLKDIGDWMNINSKSIYETSASPFKAPYRPLSWGRATIKKLTNGNTIIYLHVYDWPTNRQLLVPGLTNDIVSATFLAGGKAITTTKQADGIMLSVPSAAPDPNSTVIKIEVVGAVKLQPYIQQPDADGSITLYPSLANIQNTSGGDLMKPEGDENNQDLGYWTDAKSSASWQINVTKPGTYTVITSVAGMGDASVINLNTVTQKISMQVPNTGDYSIYQNVTFGKLKIDNAGTVTVTLSANESNWSPVNIRKITLVP